MHDLQVMLNSLAAYAEEKGLTVNVSKSKVVVFSAGSSADLPVLTLGAQRQEVVNEFKYPGVIFERRREAAHPVVQSMQPGRLWRGSSVC